jgi:magnesium chelatase family protein
MGEFILSAGSSGLHVYEVQLESSFGRGFAGTQLLGVASEVSRDGKERAKAALESCGIEIPPRKLLLSVTPADAGADGSQLDLPFALTLASCIVERPMMPDVRDYWFLAELGLTGELRPVKNIISYALMALSLGRTGLVVSSKNLPELSTLRRFGLPGFERFKIVGFDQLQQTLSWAWGQGTEGMNLCGTANFKSTVQKRVINFDDMLLTREQKMAAMTCAAGGHSLLVTGTPGCGKSMFAMRLPSILPRMPEREHLEALCIHNSQSGQLQESLLMGEAPCRAPHHQASPQAILGTPDVPGELSLAHGGVLFLDELPEFRRDLLESLREPLETGKIHVARAHKRVCWNAKVMLVAAANLCPCGWYGSKRRRCTCAMNQILAYHARLSGPVRDRIDMHVSFVPPESLTALLERECDASSEQSSSMRAQVDESRIFAKERNRRFGIELNREIEITDIAAACGLEGRAIAAMVKGLRLENQTSRSLLRMLRVARSLADLRFEEAISYEDLEQAVHWQYAGLAEAAMGGVSDTSAPQIPVVRMSSRSPIVESRPV